MAGVDWLSRVVGTRHRNILQRNLLNPRLYYYYGIFLFILFLVAIPLVFYVWGSFWSQAPGLGGHFTLDGYRRLFRPQVYRTVENTFVIAIAGSFVALFFGTFGMFFAIKTDLPGRRLITILFIVQYLMPSYIAAIAWQFWMGNSGFVNVALMFLFGFQDPPLNIHSVWGIAVVTGTHYAGLVYLLVSGAVRSVPSSLEEASRLSGASVYRTFSNVTLRLSIPAFGIAIVLIFARLIQSFGVPIILGVPGNIFVVATHMYFALVQHPPGFTFASAMGMIILFVSLGGLVLQRRITGRREKYETVGGEGGDVGTMVYDVGSLKVVYVPFVVLLIGVYLMPYLSLFFNSFQANYAGLLLHEAEWTTRNYYELLFGTRSFQFWQALKNSLLVSGIGGILGMAISALASYVIVKSDSRIRDFLDFLTLSPAAMPGIIVGTAFLWIFVTYDFIGIYGTIWLIMIALTARFIVYGVRATNSSFRSIGSELEEVARISGAGFFSIFKDIYVPLIRPGFTAGYLLLFIDYLKVLTIPLLLQGTNSQLLSVAIWEIGAIGFDQMAAAISMILILLVTVMYLIAEKFTKRGLTEI